MLTLDHFVGSGKLIARAVGEARALLLLEQYGGQSFWICKSPKPEHVTSRKLGLDVHKVLSETWPESDFELPMATHVHKNMRNDCVIEDAQYLSMREMVEKYKLTRGQIQSILRNKSSNSYPVAEHTQKQLKFLDI